LLGGRESLMLTDSLDILSHFCNKNFSQYFFFTCTNTRTKENSFKTSNTGYVHN
jgi:hypothetical protein